MIKSINLLEKNGITIFNAPNKKRALLKNIPWISGCAPPDLRTLFLPETFSIFIKNKPLLLNMVHIKPKIEKGGWFISKIKGIKEMPFSVNSKFLDYKLPQTKSKKINLFKNIIVIIIGIFVPNFFYESDFGLFVIIKNKQK